MAYKVPFVDPKEHYRRYKAEIDHAFTDTLSKGDLVLRLKHALQPALLEHIKKEFAGLLLSGTFEQTTALPAEANDVELAELPRLKITATTTASPARDLRLLS